MADSDTENRKVYPRPRIFRRGQKDPVVNAEAPVEKKLQIGLALGSGLARGFAHIGVIRALRRHSIEPTIVAGTSMGALVGGAYLAGTLDALEAWALSLTRVSVMSYLDFRVKSGGVIGGKRLIKLMEENFGEIRAEDLPSPYIAIAADLATGHEVWMRRGRLVDVMRASFSLPGVFPPVFLHNRWLVDGALVNPVPVSPLLANGARMTIAVNAGGDMMGKAMRPGAKIPTIAGFDPLTEFEGSSSFEEASKLTITKRLFRREKDTPSLFGVMMGALNIVQDRLSRSRLAGDPPDVVIVPRVGHIGMMEFDRAREIIEEGEAAVERALPDLLAAHSMLFGGYGDDESERNL